LETGSNNSYSSRSIGITSHQKTNPQTLIEEIDLVCLDIAWTQRIHPGDLHRLSCSDPTSLFQIKTPVSNQDMRREMGRPVKSLMLDATIRDILTTARDDNTFTSTFRARRKRWRTGRQKTKQTRREESKGLYNRSCG
jgi:hypothetical protein